MWPWASTPPVTLHEARNLSEGWPVASGKLHSAFVVTLTLVDSSVHLSLYIAQILFYRSFDLN